MIQFFRSFFQSKIGIGVTLAFLGLIAVAFASSDVANTGTFGGVAGGDRVAVVGDKRITTADLTINTNSALVQSRDENPTLTMEAFVAQGALDDVLEQMISRSAIAEYARQLGLRASTRLVDSEIRSIPGFRGLDGSFDIAAFRSTIRQRNLTEAIVRDDLGMELLASQLLLPVAYSATMPDSVTRRYAALDNETRSGTAVTVPASLFVPEGEPEEAELEAYYQANRARYIQRERRTLRYSTFNAAAVGELAAITDEQIAARYERDAAIYAATETRNLTRLVVPTEAAAQAVIDEVNGGVPLEVSATTKGLATVTLEQLQQSELQSQSSAAVAEAAFAAETGDLAGPVRGSLGFYVLRVDAVQQVSGQTLAQASDAIRLQLSEEQRTLALNELTEQLEDDFADGRSLSEVAQQMGVELQTVAEVTADGQIFGQQAGAPLELGSVLNFAFQMDEGQPQLAEIVAGEQFLLFEVADIVPSSAAPLDDISDRVTFEWRRDQAMAAAGEASARILARVEEGSTLVEAIAEEDVAIPNPAVLSLSRAQLLEQGRLSRASILFFSMAEGTTKRVEVDSASTWFVVQLDEITTPEIADDAPELLIAGQRLNASLGQELVQQMVNGVEASLDIEVNESSVEAVRAQLTNVGN